MNRFVEKVKAKSDKSLEEIVSNRKNYVEELVLAAIDEIERRGASESNFENVKAEIGEKQEKKKAMLAKVESKPPIPKVTLVAVLLIVLSAVLSIVYGYSIGKSQVSVSFFEISLIPLLLIFTAWRIHSRSNLMRWVYTAIVAVGTIFFVFVLFNSLILNVASSLNFLLQTSAAVLLNLKASHLWFSVKNDIKEEEFIFKD